MRLAIGPRDIENGTVEVARRDNLSKETVSLDGIDAHIADLLDQIQENIYKKAIDFRAETTTSVETYDEFKKVLEEKGGFILAHWDGTPETEEKIKNETKATIRCIPLDQPDEDGVCMVSGKPSKKSIQSGLSVRPIL